MRRLCDGLAEDRQRAREASVTGYSPSVVDALRDASVVVRVTEWPEYKDIDPVWARTLVKTPTIIDVRNTLDLVVWRAAGWTYVGLGRP